jgi:hypothetical protein
MRTITVGGSLTLEWDSEVKVNESNGELDINEGLSYEVWDYIHRSTGLKEVFLTPTHTWGSKTASHCKSFFLAN